MQTFEPSHERGIENRAESRTHAASRRFTRGHWDLRKEERRRIQAPIHFMDRRQAERRAFSYAAIEFRPLNQD